MCFKAPKKCKKIRTNYVLFDTLCSICEIYILEVIKFKLYNNVYEKKIYLNYKKWFEKLYVYQDNSLLFIQQEIILKMYIEK